MAEGFDELLLLIVPVVSILYCVLREALGNVQMLSQHQVLEDQLVESMVGVHVGMLRLIKRQRMSGIARGQGGLVHDLSFDDVLVEDVLRGSLGNAGDVCQVVEATVHELWRATTLGNGTAVAGRTELPVDALKHLCFQHGG